MKPPTRKPLDRNGWNQRYLDGDLPWDSGVPDSHLAAFLREHQPPVGKVLEIGCGTGTNAVWLAGQGFAVTGLDLSEEAVKRARERASEAGVECHFFAADILQDPIPGGPYPLAYDRGCFHVFREAEDRARFASRVAEQVAPGGLWHSLIGSTDGPPREVGPPRLRAEDVAAAVEPGFEILSLSSTHFDQRRHEDVRAWFLVARRREE